MVCENCGREIPDNIDDCQFCSKNPDTTSGSQNSVMQEADTNDLQDNKEKRYAQKAKKVYFVTVGIIIGIILLSMGVKAAFELSKTPKQLYMQAEKKSFSLFVDDLNSNYEKIKKVEAENLNSKPYECKTEVSVGAEIKEIPGIPSLYSRLITSTLGKLKFTNDSKIDTQNKKSLSDFKILVEENPLIDASIFRNDKQIGVKVPVLYNKYFTGDLSDMKTLYKNLGIPDSGTIPNKVISKEDINAAIKINPDDVSSLLGKYGKLYYDNLDEKSISLQKNAIIDFNGEKITCNKFTLALDEKQFKALIETFYNTMSEDDKLIDLTQGNIANILNLYKDSGYLKSMPDMSSLTNKATFKENLKAFKKTFKGELDKLKLPHGFKMTLLVDSQNNIIDRRFDTTIIPNTGDDAITAALEFKNWVSGKDTAKNKSVSVLLSSKKDNSKLDFKIDTKSTLDESMENGDESININWALTGSNTASSKMNFVLNSKKSKDKVTNHGKNDLQFNFSLSQNNSDFSGDGQILTTSWANKNSKTDGYNSTVKINFKAPGSYEDSLSLSANIKQDYTREIDFKLPEINSINSVNLNKATSEELNGVMQEIQGAVQKFFFENMNLFSK